MQPTSWARVLGAAVGLALVLGGCSGDVARVNACLRYAEEVCDAFCPVTTTPSPAVDCATAMQDNCANRFEDLDESGEEVDFSMYIDTCLTEVERARAAAGECLNQLPSGCP